MQMVCSQRLKESHLPDYLSAVIMVAHKRGLIPSEDRSHKRRNRMIDSNDDQLLLTRERAADVLAVSPRTLQRMSAPHGPIPVVSFGTGKRRIVRYRISDLEAFCDNCRTGSVVPSIARPICD